MRSDIGEKLVMVREVHRDIERQPLAALGLMTHGLTDARTDENVSKIIRRTQRTTKHQGRSAAILTLEAPKYLFD